MFTVLKLFLNLVMEAALRFTALRKLKGLSLNRFIAVEPETPFMFKLYLTKLCHYEREERVTTVMHYVALHYTTSNSPSAP